jgi:micrococcal nuclease
MTRATSGSLLRVIDGDTLELSTGETVRLIGVDTPETKDPRQPVEAFGKEASAFTTQLVEGKHIHLEFDVQRLDQYQRLLAYVYVGDVMLNAELVRQGYAQVATFAPNVKHQGLFLKLQREAREARRGLRGL